MTCGTVTYNLPFYTHQSRGSSSGASSRFGGFLPLFITRPVTHPDAMYLSLAATLTISRSSALPAQSQCSVDTPIAAIIQPTTDTVTMYSLRSRLPFRNSACCLSGFNVLHLGTRAISIQVPMHSVSTYKFSCRHDPTDDPHSHNVFVAATPAVSRLTMRPAQFRPTSRRYLHCPNPHPQFIS